MSPLICEDSDKKLSTKNHRTAIVYICSPDHYEHFLFTSIRSLLSSGSHFDCIVVFCIGNKPKYWNVLDPRILIIEVDSLMDNYFLGNKCYALSVEADRLIFLDADTIILKPIDNIYQNSNADFIGRIASHYYTKGKKIEWVDILKKYKAANMPYFNAGFFIFQNNSHRKLYNVWKNLIQDIIRVKDAEHFHEKINADQVALSIALGKSSLTCQFMTSNDHGYQWTGDSHENCIVYHTGGNNFFKTATMLEVKYNFYKLNLPKFKYGFNRIIINRWLRFLAYKGFIFEIFWLLRRLRGR